MYITWLTSDSEGQRSTQLYNIVYLSSYMYHDVTAYNYFIMCYMDRLEHVCVCVCVSVCVCVCVCVCSIQGFLFAMVGLYLSLKTAGRWNFACAII